MLSEMLSNINQRKIFSAVFSFNQLRNTKVSFKRDKKFTKIIKKFIKKQSMHHSQYTK